MADGTSHRLDVSCGQQWICSINITHPNPTPQYHTHQQPNFPTFEALRQSIMFIVQRNTNLMRVEVHAFASILMKWWYRHRLIKVFGGPFPSTLVEEVKQKNENPPKKGHPFPCLGYAIDAISQDSIAYRTSESTSQRHHAPELQKYGSWVEDAHAVRGF